MLLPIYLSVCLSGKKQTKALDGKFVLFIHIIKCQSIDYNSVIFQVDLLRNKKVTIYRSACINNTNFPSSAYGSKLLADRFPVIVPCTRIEWYGT